MASCLFSNTSEWVIKIPETHTTLGVVYYDVDIRIGNVFWSVSRRYNEFVELNTILIKEQGINKDILPPKKYIGNFNPVFIDQRRAQLELYLNVVFKHLVKTMPLALASFLQLEEHDVMFIIRNIPLNLSLTASKKWPELNILQLHSISVRLQLPCPPAEMSGYQHDFCAILEACSRLTSLRVEGKESAYSNIDCPPTMDFIAFKALKRLILNKVPPDLIVNADALRNTLSGLSWKSSGLKTIEEAFLCDTVHKDCFDQKIWSLRKVDLSDNLLTCIGDSIMMLPHLVGLDLNGNRIESLSGLNMLGDLEKLSLKNNGITHFDRLNLDPCLKSLSWLNLADNNIVSLQGIESLKNLKFIDVSNNQISELKDVQPVHSLPHLTSLILQRNPISTICDYRIKIFELFGKRVRFVSLDHEFPSQKELDKLAVLQALRIVKEGKSPL